MSPYIRMLRARLGNFKLLMPSVSAHIFEADRLLLVRQRDGDVWSTPGGSIEPDERPEEAVIREVREETGLTVTRSRLVAAFGGPEFVVRYPNGDETQYVILAYACEVADGALSGVSDETLEARYFSFAEIKELNLAGWLRGILVEVFDGRTR